MHDELEKIATEPCPNWSNSWYLQDATHYVANPLSGQDPPFICHSKSHQSLQLDGDGIGWLVGSKEDMAGWKSFAFFIWYHHISSRFIKYHIISYYTILVLPEATFFCGLFDACMISDSSWGFGCQSNKRLRHHPWRLCDDVMRNDARYIVETFVSRSWKKLAMVARLLQNHLPVVVIIHWSLICEVFAYFCKIVGSNK